MNSGEMGLAHRNCSARSLRAVLGQSPSLSSKPCFSRQEWHQGLSRPALPCLLKWFPSPPPTPTQILLPRPACCLDLFSPSQCLTQPGLGGVGRDIVTPPHLELPGLRGEGCAASLGITARQVSLCLSLHRRAAAGEEGCRIPSTSCAL